MSTIRADIITDAAGTGAPDFPNGLTSPNATASTPGLLERKNRFQIKYLPANVGSSGVLTGLTFNNLVPGRVYRATINFFLYLLGGTSVQEAIIAIKHNNVILTRCLSRDDDDTAFGGTGASLSAIFVATTTTVVFEFFENGNQRVEGNGTGIFTNATLEELGSYEETTAFT